MTTQDAAPVADQPVAWMVKWSTQSIPSFYGSEDSAKEALEQYNQNGAVFPLYSTPPDSLAVAQALEMAAKLQDDEAAFLNEALSHTRLNTSANWSLARQVKECQNRAGAIRSLIPADLAAEARRQAEDTERIDKVEKLGPVDNMPYFFRGEWHLWQGPEQETFPNLRAAIDAARDTK